MQRSAPGRKVPGALSLISCSETLQPLLQELAFITLLGPFQLRIFPEPWEYHWPFANDPPLAVLLHRSFSERS